MKIPTKRASERGEAEHQHQLEREAFSFSYFFFSVSPRRGGRVSNLFVDLPITIRASHGRTTHCERLTENPALNGGGCGATASLVHLRRRSFRRSRNKLTFPVRIQPDRRHESIASFSSSRPRVPSVRSSIIISVRQSLPKASKYPRVLTLDTRVNFPASYPGTASRTALSNTSGTYLNGFRNSKELVLLGPQALFASIFLLSTRLPRRC